MILFDNKFGKPILYIFLVLLALLVTAYFYLSDTRIRTNETFFTPPETTNIASNDGEQYIEVIADDLNVPWEIVFLPSGDMLVTERQGAVIQIGKERKRFSIENVEAIGEGGLLGMALHPNYEQNDWIYLYLTTKNRGKYINRVERYRFDGSGFFDRTIIIDNIPAGANHNGGRILFGPDDFLYITTGDAESPDLAQDENSLAGKILRLKDNGDTPEDNPFGNEVWSYGHRNPQGLAFDNQGRLWATEHGRSGVLSGLDELNLIEKGKNYGWPIIQGNETANDTQTPVINSGVNETWAPAGLVYINNRLFFAGLRGQSIYEVAVSDEGVIGSLKVHLKRKFGRIRAIKVGPDGFLYISTSNTDGRGSPGANDDRIIKVNPEF
ncbi:hypothetical protein A2982_01425 [candidate division WWE3 bacterium RIFCSPLOWO2_01_FULL_39_13]|uniref:Glucose/Sorbosone dehydrogenase domain-containing protein n=1 Tax=candidate division WWE3 bacterium RIFCSPLOWO2_01_FULL_39_13 TaxID=1802624 RepID=A0A1F4V6A4_UNCKA|nr:MAG: hypothetical protein A2982_01425 [candidate division WWE3 bacterium RIFCSPLOWO2_01_FULL_39_13]